MLYPKRNSKGGFYLTLGITAVKYWEVNAETTGGQSMLLNTIEREPSTSTVKQTKTIYLEDGDTTSGLEHIMARHGGDFERKFGAVGKQAVADKIHEIILEGDSCTYGFQQNTSLGGFSVCYKIDKKSYLQVVVSNSGFIVTAYPRRKAKQSDWDYRKKKRKKRNKGG